MNVDLSVQQMHDFSSFMLAPNYYEFVRNLSSYNAGANGGGSSPNSNRSNSSVKFCYHQMIQDGRAKSLISRGENGSF